MRVRAGRGLEGREAESAGRRLTRRSFLRDALVAAGAVAASAGGGLLARPAGAGRPRPPGGAQAYGPLQGPDANGLRLPAGFTSRVVARSGSLVAGTSYVWHGAPDGGAVFPLASGGYVYVSNAELAAGGVGAIRFDAAGAIADAYRILSGTSRNCAGGPTPWGTWLSCEEIALGHVWECDPQNAQAGVRHAGLGSFNHEAAAVDPFHGRVYLTEDRVDGLLYRFTPDAYPDLSAGVLEAAEAVGDDPFSARPLVWHPIPLPNPTTGQTHTRYQVPEATTFDGGEGAWYERGIVYFGTKGDNRIWSLNTFNDTLRILYDRATSPNPLLSGIDNVFVTPARDVFVAEDGGNMEIVAITPLGSVVPVLRLDGHSNSEITGPALDPSGGRLYFSSQRGANGIGIGTTYEVTGPFV
ncbi:MAG TPA: alkaline phosphatase PhoX [Myxococcota bacterium]|nr:alkaline phosphatase PhoX [Myxococcota bacterium]